MTQRLHQPDIPFLAAVFAIIIFGIIMLSSASSVVSYESFGNSNYLINHQLIFGILIGGVALLITYRIDYHVWKRFAFPMLIATVILLILVLVPGVGYGYGGARRWILLGTTTFQPSELLKLTFLIYLATWLERRTSAIKDISTSLIPFLVILGSLVILIMLQPDFGTMSIIAIISLVVYYIAGAPTKHVIWIIVSGLSAFYLMILTSDYRAARFTVFLNPELDPQGIGYHINQALMAIGSGGIFGVGLGHSRQKYNFLPEVTGDSIFAVIAEEVGFILSVALILLYVYVLFRGLRIARGAPDTFGKLLAAGIISWFSIQALINIAAMVGVLPLTGIPLPFVSYGSSALVISLAAVGILANISRQTRT